MGWTWVTRDWWTLGCWYNSWVSSPYCTVLYCRWFNIWRYFPKDQYSPLQVTQLRMSYMMHTTNCTIHSGIWWINIHTLVHTDICKYNVCMHKVSVLCYTRTCFSSLETAPSWAGPSSESLSVSPVARAVKAEGIGFTSDKRWERRQWQFAQ